MPHKFLPAVLLAAVVSLGLLTGCSGDTDTDTGPTPSPSTEAAANSTSGTLTPGPFESIDLAVKAADIQLRIGDDYTVEYYLHGKEPLEQAQVVDGTLHFSTGMDPLKLSGSDRWRVFITVPADAKLDKIHLYTAAGSITCTDLAFAAGTMETVSGEILLTGLTCDTLEIHSVADDIDLTACQIGQLTADSKSDDISVQGDFDTVSLYSVSGDVEFQGTVTAEAELETVSGDVEITAPAASINAETVGEIEYNGGEYRRELNIGTGSPTLRLKSVSGEIEIEAH